MIDKINLEIWRRAKPSHEFTKDYLVISVLGVIDIFEKWAEETEQKLIKETGDIVNGWGIESIIKEAFHGQELSGCGLRANSITQGLDGSNPSPDTQNKETIKCIHTDYDICYCACVKCKERGCTK